MAGPLAAKKINAENMPGLRAIIGYMDFSVLYATDEQVEAAIRNPWTHIISHPGDGTAELFFEPLVLAAKESKTLLEINNSSLNPVRHKETAVANNLEILRLCKQYEVPVILGSDAHFAFDIAGYSFIYPLLTETEFPEELIMNDKPEKFLSYLNIPLS